MTEKRTASFGPYTLDLRSGEFRKFGLRVKMGEQPFQILAMLLERPGEMVSREELRARLWPSDTFVDFDHGLNSAVQRLRDCLSDTAEKPQWVETVPRRGYRFVGNVDWTNRSGAEPKTDAVIRAEAPAPTAVPVQEPAGTIAPPRRKVRWIAGVAAVGALVTLWYGLGSRLRAKPAEPFQSFKITQVRNNGKVIAAAISPDGKYLLNVQEDHGEQSVWLHHVETNSDVQVIAATPAAYQNPVFSPDGNYFYLRKALDQTRNGYGLLRAPMLGGAPQVVVRELDSPVTFSPDGSRMVFARANDPEVGRYLVITAKADGTDEKIYSSGDITTWPQIVAWSPGGKKFATLPYGGMQGTLSPLVILDVSTRSAEVFGPFKRNYLSDVAWMPGDEGLLVLYQNPPNQLTRAQIGYLDRRVIGANAKNNEGGRVDASAGGGSGKSADEALRSITRDTNSYQTLTVSADGRMLATVKQTARPTLYLMPASGFSGKAPEPAAAQDQNSSLFGWTVGGDVYFGGGSELLEMSRDGKSKTALLRDADTVVWCRRWANVRVANTYWWTGWDAAKRAK
jgi:DNA-binding winged helix-turn-helix (wHTH) protein